VKKIELPEYVLADIPNQVRTALEEDVGSGDITAQLIGADTRAEARIISRESAVMCGRAWADEVFRQLGGDVTLTWLVSDGDAVTPDQVLCELAGNARQILTGERSALNFLQTLMGTATATRNYVDAVAGKGVTILDTRKTLPGLRTAQKYAVLCGGGNNHRLALHDAFLIKENHIAACGSIPAAIREARRLAPGKRITIEVETLDEFRLAMAAGPDQVMLDEFSAEDTATALAECGADSPTIELSGSFTLERLRALPALSRPVVISIGAITKHLAATDLSLRLHASSATG
jgi:nicotinate-nucleotide pyrophosphorylase (carboxylating)